FFCTLHCARGYLNSLFGRVGWRMTVRTMNPMRNANRFKLGLFSINAGGGTVFPKFGNRWRADGGEIERAVQKADAAGLDFILPIARWKGYGGGSNARPAPVRARTPPPSAAARPRPHPHLPPPPGPRVHPGLVPTAPMII